MNRLTEQLAGLGYQAGWQLVRHLPESVASGLFEAGADRAARRNKAGARQLRRNLARVVPQAGEAELDELTRDALRSYARYWCEAFRLPAVNVDTLLSKVELAGREYLDAALAEGNGAVVALPHTGNFDVVGVWAVRQYGGFSTVAQRLRPESLYRRFVAYRESLGFEILPLTGGDTSTGRTLLARLRANKIVCLVSERDISDTGVPVTFFGEQTTMPAGPARLAAVTGAALLPLGAWFTDTGWGFRIHPPIRVSGRAGVAAATQALADVFAGDIAAHPADWHLMQPLWPADLPASAAPPVLAAQE
ncbi:MAG TPA: phosphatidylinositol mannoside acyltransferase [Pseudonocardiaceae bacterium]|jgi:KDO2-lipid IV(A) lauroyltransferase|nr:phosphatidylinositol mannoside acyltransferase [Pseudonocardiaceae bacterium]